MSTWRRHRTHRNNRASSIAPPGEEGWTLRNHRAILHSEPYASADLGAASDVDRQVLTVRGCVGLFAESDLTPTPGWRHLTGGANPPLVANIGSNARKGQINSPGRQDDSANSAHARRLFGDHANTDVHRLCALFRSHEHYALIECAKANGVEPYAHLRHVFSALPKAQLLAEVEALLPTRLDSAALAADPL